MPLVIVKSDKKAREKPCLRCGYSLRRIDSQHCPECGLSTWRSLNSNDALEWSHPAWLKALCVSCAFLAIAQAVGIAAYLLVNFFYFTPLARFEWLLDFWVRTYRWYAVIAAAYEAGLGIGLWMLSRQEGRYPDKWKGYRLACRIVAGIVIAVAAWTLISGATRWGSPMRHGIMAREFLLNISIIAGTLASFAYLRVLAKRIPSSRIVWWTGILLLAPLVSLLKATPIISMWLAFEFSGMLFAYLPLIYLPITTGFLLWFAIAFRKASVTAAKGWEAETAT
jgi:hypothetical protein